MHEDAPAPPAWEGVLEDVGDQLVDEKPKADGAIQVERDLRHAKVEHDPVG